MAQQIGMSILKTVDNHVVSMNTGASTVNDFDEATDKARAFAIKHHPEAEDITVEFNKKIKVLGICLIVAQSNTTPGTYFTLIIFRKGNMR